MHILRARKLLSSAAHFIWERTNDQLLHDLSLDFLELGEAWNQVWNMLFKLFYISKDSNKLRSKVADQIRKIAEKEEVVITGVIRNQYQHKLGI